MLVNLMLKMDQKLKNTGSVALLLKVVKTFGAKLAKSIGSIAPQVDMVTMVRL